MDLLILFIWISLFILIGILVVFLVILALYKCQITTYIDSNKTETVEINNKCIGDKLENMKKIIDYGTPINYGSVILSILGVIIILIVGLDDESIQKIMKDQYETIIILSGILIGAPLGDGLAHFTVHNIFLKMISEKKDLYNIFLDVNEMWWKYILCPWCRKDY